MFNLFKDDKKDENVEHPEKETMCVDKKITIRGDKLGDVKTVIVSPNGKDVRIMKGEW